MTRVAPATAAAAVAVAPVAAAVTVMIPALLPTPVAHLIPGAVPIVVVQAHRLQAVIPLIHQLQVIHPPLILQVIIYGKRRKNTILQKATLKKEIRTVREGVLVRIKILSLKIPMPLWWAKLKTMETHLSRTTTTMMTSLPRVTHP